MKCKYHTDLDAVATCSTCNSALCSTCAEIIAPPQCVACYKKGLQSEKDKIIGSFIKTVIIAVAMVFIWITIVKGGSNIGELFVAIGIPFGWSVLDKITPKIFLSLPIMGWVIYFSVKTLLSMLIGIFALPYVVVRDSLALKNINIKLNESELISN